MGRIGSGHADVSKCDCNIWESKTHHNSDPLNCTITRWLIAYQTLCQYILSI